MKCYLVGGAVRDKLLGLPAEEQDWLVTGASAAELLDKGYRQVGRDFPVFLHPETSEEYALPRGTPSEPGERAEIIADLVCRDLTINAMALDSEGRLIDPLDGEKNLQARVLRHTPAFTDDPLRILRLARFAARLHRLGFRVADETCELIRSMAKEGMLKALVPERAWSEIERALAGEHPRIFFETLKACHALHGVLPELDRLYGVPQPEHYHPEVDTGVHTMMVLDQACRLSQEPQTRFAALMHDLGKGTTPPELWPGHIGHEERSVWMVTDLCARLRVPNSFRDLAVMAARYHTNCHRARELKPSTLVRMLKALDAMRRPERFEQFLLACEADTRGRKGLEERPYPQADMLRYLLQEIAGLDLSGLYREGKSGTDLTHDIDRERIRTVDRAKKQWLDR
ncbi:multifunctional CCA addition/repair protein [Solemya velesiana gill symbiont]|uniref:Multifunctional CCA tRNA nucleotidyl transferase/2'3'-cyclic phosphodiesterase/2'nucleotidase/phosphatase n=1 Tax=Solemya velesiana gill symbiont TaxID=1918948 RepID=A0A1T2KWI9_9GAMM|nr:multifunctional CCA addition/repair protein [Solemya velesiana gill symbiont]OOZ37203.1 multifunctional CCA tRNA nucleotidyl transferase/2'3'-cyclic phosphodiesterase/2'nucleotidase/phosphatase [Solemya velesiana gill symbiont]